MLTHESSDSPIVTINTSQINFDILCISAFRYALGRSTYVPSVVADVIWENKDKLRKSTLELFVYEIEERKIISFASLGMSGDIECWLALQKELKEYLEESVEDDK